MNPEQSPQQPTTADAAPARLSRRQRKDLAWQGQSCANCGTVLQGPYCYVCGQPERSPIRSLLALGSDALEYLLDTDSRFVRTLRDLVVRPGRLTECYLRGQRMSFVRPVRIYLVVSAVLFLTVAWTGGFNDEPDAQVGVDIELVAGSEGLVVRPVLPAGSELPSEPAEETPAPAVAATPDATEGTDEANAGSADPKPRAQRRARINFDGQEWDPVSNPLTMSWLPDKGNAELNRLIGIVQAKSEIAQKNPNKLGQEFFRVLPTTIFLLLPIFALLLKLVLVFKRRLYMEHLMVALHSHTFIFLGILLAIALFQIGAHWPQEWTNPWYTLMGLAIAWIPLNLFLTQKRVYRQGWFGALVTYTIISVAYLFLVSFTALTALVMSLVNL